MQSNWGRILLSASTMVIVGTWCTPGLTEEADTPEGQPQSQQVESHGLEEIVVTAQRRSENLQNVPIAVTVLSADALAEKGVDTVRLLATTVPGLTYAETGTLGTPRIRGIGVAFVAGGNENSVATYVDDVYYASASASILSFNNISQIAVLKGPQGTLFGRNATGGLIQITTRDPSQTFSGIADVTVGNLETYGANLYVTGGLLDGLAADLAVHYKDQREGFGKNLFTGDDINKTRDLALRSKIKGQLGDSTTATLILDYGRVHSINPAFRPLYGSLPLDGKPYTGGPFDMNGEVDPLSTLTQYGVSLDVKHDFGFAELVSITAHRQSYYRYQADLDAEPEVYLYTPGVRIPDRQFSQEFRLVSASNNAFAWQVGAYYFWGKGSYDPVVVAIPLFGIVSNTFTSQTTNSAAGFGQATYAFTDATSLTLGARLTAETKRIDASGSVYVTAPGLSIPQGPIGASITVARPTWRAALEHKLTAETMVYASYNRGFKSGGFDPASTTVAVAFKPEVLDAFEVGIKSEILDRRLRVNAAGFYYDYRNIQLNSFTTGFSSIYNGKSAEIYGLDMDLTAAATDHLTFTLGLSLLHDRFGDFPISETAPLATGGIVALPEAGSAEGKRLPNTPDWQLNVGAEYSIPLSTGSVVLAADFFHSDKWYSTPENKAFQKPYNVTNTSATWLFGPEERHSLSLWGRNLGNVAYAVQSVIQVPIGYEEEVGEGRTFGVTLSTKF